MHRLPLLFLTLLLGIASNALLAETKSQPTTRVSSLTEQQIARARRLRAALYDIVPATPEVSAWPSQLPAGSDTHYVYHRPADVKEYASSVVLRESFEQCPDGIWVAYATGVLEFASTPAVLADCENQLAIVRPAIAKFGNVFGQHELPEVDPKRVTDRMSKTLTIKVVDPSGRPVAGAAAGVICRLGDNDDPADRLIFYDKPNDRPAISDTAGIFTVTFERVFNPRELGSLFLDVGEAPLVVRDETRGLCALDELKGSEFGTGKVHEVRLQPACHITGEITSVGRAGSGILSEAIQAFVYKPGQVGIRAIYSSTLKSPDIDLQVPPGDFGLYATSHRRESAFRFVHIEPGAHELNLRLDLPEHHSPRALIGETAPEFQEIKAWKNTAPLTLASLRGKVVLIDFWGYWCGPCIGSMSKLMRLYDQCKDKGLVIIAVHDDSVESIMEMDTKTARNREKVWGGRELPFAVALAGGGEHRIPGTGEFTRGTTTAAYCVNSFPSTFLIDPRGTIVGMPDFNVDEKEVGPAIAMVEKELAKLKK